MFQELISLHIWCLSFGTACVNNNRRCWRLPCLIQDGQCSHTHFIWYSRCTYKVHQPLHPILLVIHFTPKYIGPVSFGDTVEDKLNTVWAMPNIELEAYTCFISATRWLCFVYMIGVLSDGLEYCLVSWWLTLFANSFQVFLPTTQPCAGISNAICSITKIWTCGTCLVASASYLWFYMEHLGLLLFLGLDSMSWDWILTVWHLVCTSDATTPAVCTSLQHPPPLDVWLVTDPRWDVLVETLEHRFLPVLTAFLCFLVPSYLFLVKCKVFPIVPTWRCATETMHKWCLGVYAQSILWHAACATPSTWLRWLSALLTLATDVAAYTTDRAERHLSNCLQYWYSWIVFQQRVCHAGVCMTWTSLCSGRRFAFTWFHSSDQEWHQLQLYSLFSDVLLRYDISEFRLSMHCYDQVVLQDCQAREYEQS